VPAEARNRLAGRKETGNRWSVCLYTLPGLHRQSYAAEGSRPVFGRDLKEAYLCLREGFIKATSARGLARSGGRAERLMRSAAVTEGKRQRRSDTNQIFARPWRSLLAARAEAKFWTPYKNAPGGSGVRAFKLEVLRVGRSGSLVLQKPSS